MKSFKEFKSKPYQTKIKENIIIKKIKATGLYFNLLMKYNLLKLNYDVIEDDLKKESYKVVLDAINTLANSEKQKEEIKQLKLEIKELKNNQKEII